MKPGAPFWQGFTAFCANEAAVFAADKLQVLSIQRYWLTALGSLFVGGVVYGRAKVDELRGSKQDKDA